MDALLAEKRATFENMHAAGSLIVHLNASYPLEGVPERFLGEADLSLRFGACLMPPVRNMVVSEEGVRAVLTFSRVAHTVFVPWAAVFGMTSETARGQAADVRVWPTCVPEAVFQKFLNPIATPPSRRRSKLRLIKGGRA